MSPTLRLHDVNLRDALNFSTCVSTSGGNVETMLRQCWDNIWAKKQCWDNIETMLRQCWDTCWEVEAHVEKLRQCWDNVDTMLRQCWDNFLKWGLCPLPGPMEGPLPGGYAMAGYLPKGLTVYIKLFIYIHTYKIERDVKINAYVIYIKRERQQAIGI